MLKYDNTVSSTVDGKPIYGAQVSVYDESNALASLYSDEAGTTPLSQPVLTDQLGYFAFYIADGKYNIRVMTGAVEISRTNITMVDTLTLKERALLVPQNEDAGTLPAAGQRLGMVLAFDQVTGAPTALLPNSFDGPPGPANSTYTSLAALKQAPTTNKSYTLVANGGRTEYAYILGDFTGQADDINVVKLDAVALSAGALVRQNATGIAYQARGTSAVPISVDTLLKDVPQTPAAFASLAAAVQSPVGFRAPNGIFPTAESLSPLVSSVISGSGRERTFIRRSGNEAAYFSARNFTTYIDQTIDRSDGLGGIGISQQSPDNSIGPLEGFKVLRCNINGHTYGVDVRDAVIASLEESYIQACGTGATFNQTGPNASTVIGLRQVWFRGNSTVGLLATTVVNMQLDQTVFESGPKGFSLQACTDVQLNNGWYESLALAGEMVNCRSVAFNGGSIDGKLTGMRVFYAFGSTTACDIEFTGAWRVDNLTAFVATADGNVTITVKTPALAPYNFQALNGGRVIFDFLLTGKKTWDPPSIPALSTTMTTLPVPGLKVGDICTASFENGTNDPQSIFLNANCLADGTATVVAFNALNVALDLASGTLTILANRRPLIS